MSGLLVALAIGLPLAGGPLLALAGRKLGRRVGWLALVFPVVSFAALLALAGSVTLPGRTVIEWPWVPSLGINFSFLVDGLSLFFGFVVSGMGVLIFWYASHYLDDHYKHHGRFYCYLSLFMAAMLGTVFANHLILLFVFWEMTGLASFLLIGFLHEEEKSRVGARQALLVTGLTGLVMLVGLLLVGMTTGKYGLADLLRDGLPVEQHKTVLGWAMVLVMIGAFGKSAQIPFQFWLPNAMAAPTPVSAYLHSATMVKLGVFLAARMFPLFVELDGWTTMLAPIGFTTMALGAVLALLSNDLKAILAWSTVSALGSFIGYYGLGASGGVQNDLLHISNHVFYKGCLFMVAGVVAHATGVRDIRELGGLMRRMPLLGWTCLIAAASMAGLPGTLGFLSKEALLGELLDAPAARGGLGVYALCAVVVASVAKVAFSARLFLNIFTGRESSRAVEHFHAPGLGLQLPPMLLAACAMTFGVAPGLFEPLLHWLASDGLNPRPAHLAIWHGFTPALGVSAVVVAAGALVYVAGQKTSWRWASVPRGLQFDRLFEWGLERLGRFSALMTRVLRFDRPLDYLPIILGFAVLLMGGYLWRQFGSAEAITTFWRGVANPLEVNPLRVFVAMLMALAVLGVVVLHRWTTQLISLSVVGFLVTFYFVLYQAPDLALTQILVDTAALLLILILLGRFPKSAEEGERSGQHSRGRNALNALLSIGVGLVVTVFILLMTGRPHAEPIGQRFLDTTVELAKGSNAVNTILVDYRGLDTLFEITVLFIAMLACLGLMMRHKRTAAEFKRGAINPPGWGLTEDDPR